MEAVLILFEQNEEIADEFWQNIERGMGRHIVIYDRDRPVEVFFVGYSFD